MTTEMVDRWADTKKYHRSWYWYDWANSAFVTTVGTVLFGPYLTNIAQEAACPGLADDESARPPCMPSPRHPVSSWVWVLALVTTLVLATLTVLQFRADTKANRTASGAAKGLLAGDRCCALGVRPDGTARPGISGVLHDHPGDHRLGRPAHDCRAIADRSEQPARLLGIFAWLGAAAACMLFFLVGTNWRFGALMMIIATIGLGASLVV